MIDHRFDFFSLHTTMPFDIYLKKTCTLINGLNRRIMIQNGH